MIIREWMENARRILLENGDPDADTDTRYMAEDALGMTPYALRFEGERELDPGAQKTLDGWLSERLEGQPLQYILHNADFMGLKFYVDERVLIPRQDTETLVESAVIELRRGRGGSVLDLCCGSGCIGLSIKSLVGGAEVTLSDASTGALDIARHNAHTLKLNVSLKHGDLFHAVGSDSFDMIVSNPPYIPTAEIALLQTEVQREPEMALDGGKDGLDFYRRIAVEAPAHLKEKGSIFLEVGQGQAEDVLEMLRTGMDRTDMPAREAGIIKDLNEINRVVWARR